MSRHVECGRTAILIDVHVLHVLISSSLGVGIVAWLIATPLAVRFERAALLLVSVVLSQRAFCEGGGSSEGKPSHDAAMPSHVPLPLNLSEGFLKMAEPLLGLLLFRDTKWNPNI